MTGPAEPEDPGEPIVKDMAASWGDIVRLLPVALRGWPYEVAGRTVAVGTPERGVVITAEDLPPRRIALLEVARSGVTLTFRGLDRDERNAFLTQFDRAFQRGGG